jgi:pimeloyl-ACP methyl ester carboxylesterase
VTALAIVLGVAVGGVVVVAQPAVAAAHPEGACDYHKNFDATFNDNGIGLTSELTGRPGRYALPDAAAEPPTALVAMFHGYGNDSCSWRRHLQRVAATGAVAFAMDYEPYAGAPSNHGRRGWSVKQGATDAIAQAQYFLDRYPSIKLVVSFGISMGGNAAGLSVAEPAKRKDGSPLFDYWINVEGVTNLTEEYQVLSPLGAVNAGAEEFRVDVERETGGTLATAQPAFQQRTVVLRAPDIAATKLKGAILVHGVDDGLVPHNQVHEMTAALRAVSVPVEAYTVLRSASAEDYPDDTASAIALAALVQGYNSALAGHGWEGSNTQNVVKTGFDELFAILCGRRTSVEAFVEHTVDGDVPSPPVCAAKLRIASASGAQAAAGRASGSGSGSGASSATLAASGGNATVPALGVLGMLLAVALRVTRRRSLSL